MEKHQSVNSALLRHKQQNRKNSVFSDCYSCKLLHLKPCYHAQQRLRPEDGPSRQSSRWRHFMYWPGLGKRVAFVQACVRNHQGDQGRLPQGSYQCSQMPKALLFEAQPHPGRARSGQQRILPPSQSPTYQFEAEQEEQEPSGISVGVNGGETGFFVLIYYFRSVNSLTM